MKVGILQLNCVVGDCAGNAKKILAGYQRLCSEGAQLVVGPELAILGYPPKDLLDSKAKVDEQLLYFETLRESVGDVGLVIGLAEWNPSTGKPLFNNGVFIRDKKVVGRRSKELLPTYDVFDEQRYFERGPRKPCIVPYNGKRIGLIVCEDAWGGTENPTGEKLYSVDPVEDILMANPDLLVIINASPYYWGKGDVRFKLVSNIARRVGAPIVYANQVGGDDDLVFDGRSFSVSPEGMCTGALYSFKEEFGIINTEETRMSPYLQDEGKLEQLYQALVMGTRDYLAKTGHSKVVIGESGGIDSALTTCIAVDAVGAENVMAIGMPSEFSSKGSVEHSRELCANLGVKFEVVPIRNAYDSFGNTVRELLGWNDPEKFGRDVTEENVQARLRGAILMAYSNRTGALVLSTGNKSELAVGYCTLYGDMVGGLAVISDVPKTLVYDLAGHVNNRRRREIIPLQIIDKAPSAELRPDQKDQDSLPPYHVLDGILYFYIEQGLDESGVVEQGFELSVVQWVLKKVNANEHKRRQAALGLKVTTKAFGSGRRIPIATKPQEIPVVTSV